MSWSQAPIAVYQMGKVGSESIFYSLQQLVPNLGPLFHVHVLSPSNLERSLDHLASKGRPLTLQLQHSKQLRDYLDRRPDAPLRVITAVREPVAQFVSSFMQNISLNNPDLLDSEGNVREQEAHQFLCRQFEKYDTKTAWNCTWFDRDFRPALGINVYEKDFDREAGVTCLAVKNLEVLILRLENIASWSRAITRFLRLKEELVLLSRNRTAEKPFNDAYKGITAHLKLGTATLDNVYSSKYCHHFYSQEMIDGFRRRWGFAHEVCD